MAGKTLFALLLTLIIAGCAMGPDFEEPVIETPETFINDSFDSLTVDPRIEIAWWEMFEDEVVDGGWIFTDSGICTTTPDKSRLKVTEIPAAIAISAIASGSTSRATRREKTRHGAPMSAIRTVIDNCSSSPTGRVVLLVVLLIS